MSDQHSRHFGIEHDTAGPLVPALGSSHAPGLSETLLALLPCSAHPGHAGTALDDAIYLVSGMHYELRDIDLQQRALQAVDNPFGAKL